MSTEIEQLNEWFEKARRERGLVDVKFYPGDRRDILLREAAGEALKAVTNRSTANHVITTGDKL